MIFRVEVQIKIDLLSSTVDGEIPSKVSITENWYSFLIHKKKVTLMMILTFVRFFPKKHTELEDAKII